ncbi:hypothetical protein BDB01DRAFT_838042 [Pilobolus umbonatus]|nr:hypothetical protein BDB01DRAFT_838042 [Pilobolus umbonatus]
MINKICYTNYYQRKHLDTFLEWRYKISISLSRQASSVLPSSRKSLISSFNKRRFSSVAQTSTSVKDSQTPSPGKAKKAAISNPRLRSIVLRKRTILKAKTVENNSTLPSTSSSPLDSQSMSRTSSHAEIIVTPTPMTQNFSPIEDYSHAQMPTYL